MIPLEEPLPIPYGITWPAGTGRTTPGMQCSPKQQSVSVVHVAVLVPQAVLLQ
jgi:hypothetical protein